jgi:hypothetical protein
MIPARAVRRPPVMGFAPFNHCRVAAGGIADMLTAA